MIISHRHRYLFVEVPHTASSAISRELEQNYAGEQVLYKHANYSEFRRIAEPSERKYFVFAAVRNPLDTVVTEYAKFRSNHGNDYTDPQRYAENDGWIPQSHLEKFKFIHENNADFSSFLERFYSKVYHQWVLVSHQRYDFVMRFERIQEDFTLVLNKLGLKPVRPLPVVNSSKREKNISDYYTATDYRLAARVFGPFMRKWGYALPPEWGALQAPLGSRINFAASEAAVNFVSRFVSLSPYDPFVQSCKSLARRVGIA